MRRREKAQFHSKFVGNPWFNSCQIPIWHELNQGFPNVFAPPHPSIAACKCTTCIARVNFSVIQQKFIISTFWRPHRVQETNNYGGWEDGRPVVNLISYRCAKSTRTLGVAIILGQKLLIERILFRQADGPTRFYRRSLMQGGWWTIYDSPFTCVFPTNLTSSASWAQGRNIGRDGILNFPQNMRIGFQGDGGRLQHASLYA